MDVLSGSYEYDTLGRLWKINRNGYSYEFVYDSNGLNQIVGVKIANVTSMTYDYWLDDSGVYHTGLLKTQTYGNTDYVGFIYTDEKQVESISFNGTIRYEYTYDSSGNLSILKDIHNDNIYFYSYDLAGRLEIITDKDGNEITYEYDESGNVDRYHYSISGISRAVTYNYNHTSGEYDYTTYTVSGTTIKKDYNYDTDSLRRLHSIDLTIGTKTFTKTFTYDDAKVDSSMGNATHRIYQITYQINNETQIHQYTYDENHNITRIEVKESNDIIEQYDYEYDGFNQLTREDIKIDGIVSKTMVYGYDLQSNITSIKTYAYQVTTGTPQSEKKMFYQNTWKDQLTKIEYYVNGSLNYYQTFTYDASGNVIGLVDSRTSYANKSYQWDGRQLSYYSAYCNSISFKYNDQGIRTQKAQGTCSGNVTTDYTLDGDKVLVETRSNGITLYFTYDVDGTLLSMNYNGAEYFYITNMQGDIIELVDINGVSVVKYKYDAWGNIVGQTGGSLADINPYRYRGYRFDVETGLYYLQSRYYDPAIGRFISSDGLLGETGNLATHNMYAYCANNPVMYVDPEGDSPLIILIVLLSVMLTVTLMAIAPAENNAGDNGSVSWSATPDPLTFGFDMFGVGGSYTFGQPGVTCNLADGCQGFTQTIGGQVGPFGGSHVEYEDGTYTDTISFLVFYVSLDNLDYDDISSWGAGLTFGTSYGAPNTGSGSASLDIDFLGLIRDLFHKGD